MKRRFAFTSMLNVVGIGLGFLTTLFITPFVLRALGKEAYGVWVLVTSFSVVSGYLSLLDLGIQSAVVKFVAEHYSRQEIDEVNQIITSGLYLFGFIGCVGATALILFAWAFLTSVFNIPPSLVPVTRLLLYMLAIQTTIEFPGLILSATLDGLQQYALQRAIQIGYVVLYTVFLVVLLSRGYGLIALSLTMIILAVGRAVVMAILVRRLLPQLQLVRHFEWGTLRRVAKFSGEIFLVRLGAVIYNTMDKVIIGAMLTSTLLTDYDIANKMRIIVMASLSFITPQIVPIAARFNATEDRARLQELFLKGTKYQLAICLPVVVLVFVLAEDFIRLWIGPTYVYTAGLARLFVSYLILDAIVVVGQNIMFGMGIVRPVFKIQLITTTGINLIISILLTPWVGIAGVILGTLVGTVFSIGPYLRLYLTSLDIAWSCFWRDTLWHPFVVTVIWGLLLFAAERLIIPDNLWSLLGLGLSGLVIYGITFWQFGLSPTERVMLLQVVKFPTR